jgi:hypothetical protein
VVAALTDVRGDVPEVFFELAIKVDEGNAEAIGQRGPNGALPCTSRADQRDRGHTRSKK